MTENADRTKRELTLERKIFAMKRERRDEWIDAMPGQVTTVLMMDALSLLNSIALDMTKDAETDSDLSEWENEVLHKIKSLLDRAGLH